MRKPKHAPLREFYFDLHKEHEDGASKKDLCHKWMMTGETFDEIIQFVNNLKDKK